MRDNKYIQVLWVEDDPMITSAYPNEADMVAGIELHPFPCWEEAEVELERNYEHWDAIILDAKCKYRKDDADKAGISQDYDTCSAKESHYSVVCPFRPGRR